MEAQPPSPQTTLLILLGASNWPYMPEFRGSEAFAHAAQRLRTYFLYPNSFGLPPENLLDLFDTEQSPDKLDLTIERFLRERQATLTDAGYPPRDILFYFIGHGGFVGRDADFYLATRRIRSDNPLASGLQMMAIAHTLIEKARHLRRIIILDCCFAAAAFSSFQSSPAQIALAKTVDAFEVKRKAVGFPTKGTTLLCSSSHKSPSLILPDESSTMFTNALLDALTQGINAQQDRLSIRDVKEVAIGFLSEINNAPKPTVLSPDQSEGDIADIPFFPNPWLKQQQQRDTEQEHIRQEEEEKQRRASIEQVVRDQEERDRQALKEAHMQILQEPLSQRPRNISSQPSQSSVLPTQFKKILSTLAHYKYTLVVLLILLGGGSLTYFEFFAQRGQIHSPTPTQTPVTATTATGTVKQEVMFGFDAAHTRNNSYEHTLNPHNISRLSLLWHYRTGSSIRSSPIVAGGVVYIGSDDGWFYAFDATCRKDCQFLWHFHTGGPISSAPAVAGGMVYASSNDGWLYAFDATCRKDCHPLWRYSTGKNIYSSPTVAGGVVYIGSDNGWFYAFDATCRKDCQFLWRYFTDGPIRSSPAVGGGMVYVGSNDDWFYAFDATCRKDCHPLWRFYTGGSISSSPAIAGGMVYIGSYDGRLYAFDATCREYCQFLWYYSTGAAIYSSPAVAGGMVYVSSNDGWLYAFDATCRKDCQFLWRFGTGFIISSSPTVAGGIVYVGSYDRRLYAFDATCRKDCQSIWYYSTGDSISSSPTIAGGVVYVGSFDGWFYAFG